VNTIGDYPKEGAGGTLHLKGKVQLGIGACGRMIANTERVAVDRIHLGSPFLGTANVREKLGVSPAFT